MFGALRLLLAMLVATGHLTGSFMHAHGVEWGVSAAVVFYLLSGYAMTALLRGAYQGGQVLEFYRDRVLRIAPQYYALMAITLAWWLLAGKPHEFFLSVPAPGFGEYLRNLLIVPLNYFMFNESWRFSLIPPAWMLAVELQFYLLMPFLLRYSVVRLGFLFVGLATMLLAHWGGLNPLAPAGMFSGSDIFGYRLLPGALVFFLLGSYLYDEHAREGSRPWARSAMLLAFTGIWWWVLREHATLARPYVRESLLGIGLGWCAIEALGRRRRRAWDERLGHLSYGVYLNHFLVQWALLAPMGLSAPAPGAFDESIRLGAYLLFSLAIAWLGWRLIDAPVMRRRRELRCRRAVDTAAISTAA